MQKVCVLYIYTSSHTLLLAPIAYTCFLPTIYIKRRRMIEGWTKDDRRIIGVSMPLPWLCYGGCCATHLVLKKMVKKAGRMKYLVVAMQGKKQYSEKLYLSFRLSERVPKDN